MGRYGDAERDVTQSLAIRESLSGNHQIEIAQSLSNLGGLRFRQGRYREAAALKKRALAIREKAEVLRQLKRSDEAQAAAARARAIRAKAVAQPQGDRAKPP